MPTKLKNSRTALDADRYVNFAAGLELVGLGLKSASCQLDRIGYVRFRQNAKKLFRTLDGDAKITDLGERHFDAEVKFTLMLRPGPRAAADKSLSVEYAFEAHFHIQPGTADRALVERFVQSELPIILLPYARQFISTITAQMAIPPIVIPLYGLS